MAGFEEVFDARLWAQEHGVPARGCGFEVRATADHLDAGLQIASCASWGVQPLGLGQGGGRQHEGFRGTLGSLLEKARREAERNRGLYGEASRPEFDALLRRIDDMLQRRLECCVLTVRDPAGLSTLSPELEACVTRRWSFLRSEDEIQELGIACGQCSAPARQVTTAAEVADLVRQAANVVALTGAGISVESGITPFRRNPPGACDSWLPSWLSSRLSCCTSREKAGTVWGTFDAAKMTSRNFNTDAGVREAWWDMKRSLMREAEAAIPNPAHCFFGLLEREGKLGGVVTQNIDSLHAKGDVPKGKVVELHGHMRGVICSDRRGALNPQPFRGGGCDYSLPEEAALAPEASWRLPGVPLCPRPGCGCPLRTETVMFEQPMPEEALDAARDLIDGADLLFIVGSTLLVRPANELPLLALRRGTPVVMINFDPTAYDALATGLVRAKAGEFLGAVAQELVRGGVGRRTTAQPGSRCPRPAEASAAQARAQRVAKEAARHGREVAARGRPFFCACLEEPDGDLALLAEGLRAANAEAGSARVGKMLFSAGAGQLAVLAYVPEERQAELGAEAWLRRVLSGYGDGRVLESSAGVCSGCIPANPSAGVFPVKIKEGLVLEANKALREAGLLPEDDDSDDEPVFGYDDFPA